MSNIVDYALLDVQLAPEVARLWRDERVSQRVIRRQFGLSPQRILNILHIAMSEEEYRAVAKDHQLHGVEEGLAKGRETQVREKRIPRRKGVAMRREGACRCGFLLSETHLAGVRIPLPVDGVCGLCQTEAQGKSLHYADTCRQGDSRLYVPEDGWVDHEEPKPARTRGRCWKCGQTFNLTVLRDGICPHCLEIDQMLRARGGGSDE